VRFQLLCIVVVLFTASLSIAQAAGNQPNIGNAAYSFTLVWLNEKVSGITGVLPLNFLKVVDEHGPDAPFLEGPLGENWADPFWDDAGWAISKDWANFGAALHGVPIASQFFKQASFLLITLEQYNQELIEWQDRSGVTDFWLSVLPHDPLVESPSSGSIAALSALGIGTPQLSPSDSGIIWFSDQSRDAPETSGDKTYFDKANDVWYVDAFSWSGDRSQHSKPAAPCL